MVVTPSSYRSRNARAVVGSIAKSCSASTRRIGMSSSAHAELSAGCTHAEASGRPWPMPALARTPPAPSEVPPPPLTRYGLRRGRRPTSRPEAPQRDAAAAVGVAELFFVDPPAALDKLDEHDETRIAPTHRAKGPRHREATVDGDTQSTQIDDEDRPVAVTVDDAVREIRRPPAFRSPRPHSEARP